MQQTLGVRCAFFIRLDKWFFILILILGNYAFAAEKHLYSRTVGEIFADRDVKSLARAAARGDLDRIDKLVGDGVDVDSQGYMGVTPLWWALQRQNPKGFEKLLQLGADPNHQWINGRSVMDHVVELKSPEYLKLALEYGGDPNLFRPLNDSGGGETPIYRALFADSSNETIELLLDAGAEINVRDHINTTPMVIAAGFRRFKLLYRMLEEGGDFTVKSRTGIALVPAYVQASLESKRALSDEQIEYRQKVVDFLEDSGVNLSEYGRRK